MLINNVTNQLDIIYFACGLAFFLIGGLAFILRRRTKGLLPWAWLGLFAFCQAFYAWLYLPILPQEMLRLLSVLRLTCLFFSFIFLIEFGRAGTETIRGIQSGPVDLFSSGRSCPFRSGRRISRTLFYYTICFRFSWKYLGGLDPVSGSLEVPSRKEFLHYGWGNSRLLGLNFLYFGKTWNHFSRQT